VSAGRILALIAFSLSWAVLFYALTWIVIAFVEATWLRAIIFAVVSIIGVAIYAAGSTAIFKKRTR